MKYLVAALILLGLIYPAEARQRHAVHETHPMCNILWPCEGVTAPSQGDRAIRVTERVHKLRVANVDPRHIVRERAAPAALPAIRQAAQPGPSGFGAPRPMRYIAGRLICAVNVNAYLAEQGIKGTGSAWARSFLTWGRSAGGPVPGAVIVSPRRGGGHVAIVSRVENGVVYAWNATGGQSGWREIPYRHRVLDYRVPG